MDKPNKTVECPWCVQTNFMCGIDRPDYDALNVCEFRNLPKEKDAILNRMAELVKSIKESQTLLKSATDKAVIESNARNILDKMFGMEKMIECLDKEFGVKRSESLKAAGYEGLTMAEKARALMQLKKLNRGAK